jgi:hypothetical protein
MDLIMALLVHQPFTVYTLQRLHEQMRRTWAQNIIRNQAYAMYVINYSCLF